MEYIMESAPFIKDVDKLKFFSARNKLLAHEHLSKEEIEIILDFYVSETRKALKEVLDIDILSDPLENTDDLTQKLIGLSLEKIGVIVYPEETTKTISPDVLRHSYCVGIFNENEPYLIDLSYRQFFVKDKCDVNLLTMEDDFVVTAPYPGYFASLKDPLRDTATEILEKGYITLTEENAKHYGDTFYFAKTGRSGYSNIPGSVYMNAFLKERHKYSMSDERLKETGIKI